MGKGSGGCTNRMPLELFTAEESAPIHVQGEISTWDEKVSRYLHMQTKEEIELALQKEDSTILRHVLFARLRDVKKGAKESEVPFSEQILQSAALFKRTKHHPTEGQALFFEQSVFRDDMIYVSFQKQKNSLKLKQPIVRLFAEIDESKEDALIEAMVNNGATITKNPFQIPTYSSWAVIHPGSRLSLSLGEGKFLHYVPHRSVGTKKQVQYSHKVTIPGMSDQEVTEAQKQTEKSFEKHKYSLEQMLITHADYTHDKSQNFSRIVFPSREKYGKNMLKMAETGETILRKKGHPKYEHTLSVSFATEESMKEFSDYMVPFQDGYLYSRFAKKMKTLHEEMEATKKPVQVSFRSNHKSIALGLVQTKALQNCKNDSQSKWVQTFCGAEKAVEKLEHTFESKTFYHDVPQQAPFSERGCVRAENLSPQEIEEFFQKNNLCSKFADTVPYDLFYKPGNKKRLGRVCVKHEDYLRGEHLEVASLKCLPFHGMTGVQTSQQAIERLKLIHDFGGLKSVSERSRLGLGRVSQSPKGDIASGIDGGVATKFGSIPSYGSKIFFAVKPEALERRDVWFSSHDFGPGHNRYDEYNHYAKKIGQGKFHWPPNHKSRKKHFSSNLQHTNEVYFKHEVHWNEIHTLFVSHDCYSEVCSLVEGWRKEDKFPGHIEIKAFSGVLDESVTLQTAKQAWKEYFQSKK